MFKGVSAEWFSQVFMLALNRKKEEKKQRRRRRTRRGLVGNVKTFFGEVD